MTPCSKHVGSRRAVYCLVVLCIASSCCGIVSSCCVLSRHAVVLLLCILAVIFHFVLFKSYCKYFIDFLKITLEGYSLAKSCCNNDGLARLVVFIDESLVLVGLLWTSLIKCGGGLPVFHFDGRLKLEHSSRTFVSASASTRGPVISPTLKRGVTVVLTIGSDGRQRAASVRVSHGQQYHDGSTSDSRSRPPG